MKLIRRILRYVMLLAFIVVLGLAYYYRTLIFSEMINTYVDGTVNSVLVWANIVPEQAEPAIQKAQETQEAQENQQVPDCEVQQEVAQATETDVVRCECEVAISKLALIGITGVDQAADDEQGQTEPEELTVEVEVGLTTDAEPEQIDIDEQAETAIQTIETDIDQAAEGEPAQTETEEQVIEPEVELPAEEDPAQTEEDSDFDMALENNPPNSHSELINQARLLHLTGNSSNAIELYKELGELYPNDPNVFGELGNVFYLQGDWERASLAYYEAALRLQKLRMTEQIHYLYLVIHGLDPDMAEKLRERLES